LSIYLLAKKIIDFIDVCEHGCGVSDQKNPLVKAITLSIIFLSVIIITKQSIFRMISINK